MRYIVRGMEPMNYPELFPAFIKLNGRTHRQAAKKKSTDSSADSWPHKFVPEGDFFIPFFSQFLRTQSTMKYTLTALAVSLLVIHLHRAVSEDAKVRIFNQWPQGFYGRISVALEDEVEDG